MKTLSHRSSNEKEVMRRNLRMDPTRVAGCQCLACFDPMLVTYNTYNTHSEIRKRSCGRPLGAKPVFLCNSPVSAKIPQRKAGIFPFAADPACNHCIPSHQKTNRNFRCVIFLLIIPNLCNCSLSPLPIVSVPRGLFLRRKEVISTVKMYSLRSSQPTQV